MILFALVQIVNRYILCSLLVGMVSRDMQPQHGFCIYNTMHFLVSCFHVAQVKVKLLLGGCLFGVCVWGGEVV